MSKKLTIGFVKSEFEKEKWNLVSKEYINNKVLLDYICPKGHIGTITWSDWKSGYRCPTCFGNKKLIIGFVKSEFKEKGWVCLSNKYINSHSKLEYVCPNGHLGSIAWHDWRQGVGCPICAGVKKHTIEYVKKEFEKEKWVCLSGGYINAYSKLEYVCPNGHLGSITWNSWQQGVGCPVCSDIKRRHSIEFVKLEFEKEEWRCLSTDYRNAQQKLNYVCSEGHLGTITWGHWKKGRRCPTCAVIRNSGSGNCNWKGGISKEPYCQNWTDDLRDYVKQRDSYKCINPYCNSKNPNDLTVHHINYNKKSCGPENLITICRSCNAKANFDRDWHEAWYKAVLYRRYNVV